VIKDDGWLTPFACRTFVRPCRRACRYAGFWQAQLPEEDADRADYLIFTRAPK
jgi:hypothetical protein